MAAGQDVGLDREHQRQTVTRWSPRPPGRTPRSRFGPVRLPEPQVASTRSARARALIAAGSIAYWQADLGRARLQPARKNFGEALRLAVEANDLASVTVALGPLSNLEGTVGDHDVMRIPR